MSNTLTQVCFTFCVVHATVANFGKHAGKKFNTQNEECMNIGISIILPLYLPIHHVQYNYADNNRKKNYLELKFPTYVMVSLLLDLLFTRLINKICLHYQTNNRSLKLLWGCIWTMQGKELRHCCPWHMPWVGLYFI